MTDALQDNSVINPTLTIVQYLRPDGRRIDVSSNMYDEATVTKAKAIQEAGLEISVEHIPGDMANFVISDNAEEMDLATALVPNDETQRPLFAKMISDFDLDSYLAKKG